MPKSLTVVSLQFGRSRWTNTVAKDDLWIYGALQKQGTLHMNCPPHSIPVHGDSHPWLKQMDVGGTYRLVAKMAHGFDRPSNT